MENGEIQESWKRGPFGIPDASRAGKEHDYFPVPGPSPDLEKTARKLHERVLIGKKGAGKTIYLRALIEALPTGRISGEQAGENWFVFREVFNLRTAQVLSVSRIARRYHSALMGSLDLYVDPRAQSRELWTRIWQNAFTASLYVLLFGSSADRRLRSIGDELIKESPWAELNASIADFFSKLPKVPSPVLMVTHFDHTARGRFNLFRQFLDDPKWEEAYILVSEAVRNAPPMALFIDAIDDDFDAAPEAWLDCQEGLFRCVFQILNRADNFSNRVHIVVALRDIVYSSLLNSEHASRYLTDSHIRYLAWDGGAARTFLVEKIRRLPANFLSRPDIDPETFPVRHWLGFDRVENPKRGTVETALDYILRHTRLLPRDIVIMGNAICEEINLRSDKGEEFTEGKLRQVVHDVARATMREAVNSCINEFLLSMDYVAEAFYRSPKDSKLLEEAARASEGEGATDAMKPVLARIQHEIRGELENNVSKVFTRLGKEKFTRTELMDALLQSGLVREEDLEVRGRSAFFRFDNILWRHGLIAFHANDGGVYRWRFSWRGIPDRPELPDSAQLYGLHPGLIDLYPQIKSIGHDPVY